MARHRTQKSRLNCHVLHCPYWFRIDHESQHTATTRKQQGSSNLEGDHGVFLTGKELSTFFHGQHTFLQVSSRKCPDANEIYGEYYLSEMGSLSENQCAWRVRDVVEAARKQLVWILAAPLCRVSTKFTKNGRWSRLAGWGRSDGNWFQYLETLATMSDSCCINGCGTLQCIGDHSSTQHILQLSYTFPPCCFYSSECRAESYICEAWMPSITCFVL